MEIDNTFEGPAPYNFEPVRAVDVPEANFFFWKTVDTLYEGILDIM